MITTTDVANILVRDCRAFGLKVHQKGNIPEGVVKTERIVVVPKRQETATYWRKGFVEINICVPDKGGKADLVRLQEMEHRAKEVLDNVVGQSDDSTYEYSIHSISGCEEDTTLMCHFVNVRILFNVLNV